MSTYDAIVVGAGPNGLVAANHLVDHGWSVLVLEEQPRAGGAVRSDSDVHPGFVHDTFSAFYPLAAASRAFLDLDLEAHGLRWTHAPAVLGHALPDGRWAMLHRDRAVTAALLDEEQRGDGDAWLSWCAEWDVIGEDVVGALLSPFPPVRSGLGALARLRKVGGTAFVQRMLTPAREIGSTAFGGLGARILIAGNAGHADIPLDAPGSGFMGLLMAMLGQTVGFPVPIGGASGLTEALVRRLESRGGELRCGGGATRIGVRDGRACEVHVGGERVQARHAVIGAVAAPLLYDRLVESDAVPARVRRGMRDFRLDPSTIKVDWALDSPVPWASPPPHAPGTVHVADSIEDIDRAFRQVAAGLVPAQPYLLVGQMTTTDSSRSPDGTESMWAYAHVPQHVTGDAGESGITGSWDESDLERFADRVQDRLERLAPGFGSRILARRVLGPHELEARDASLIGGAINGGTAQLQQQLIFRPIPGSGRAETGIPGLYLGSSSAHPGGGVHGAAGRNAARAAIAHARLRRLRP